MSRQRYSIRLADGGSQQFVLDVGRRKKLSMTFVEGELTVRVPYGCPNKQINEFIVSNTGWIRKNLDEQNKRIGLPRSFEQGERIRLLGQEYTINYVISDSYFKPFLDRSLLNVAVQEHSTMIYKQAQVNGFIDALALETVTDCMERMSALVGRKPAKVTLRSMTSRWGSCSTSGNISINCKVVQFPVECIEYVCVHELCHMDHMDHSEQFWAQVERFCPDWKKLRDQMKR